MSSVKTFSLSMKNNKKKCLLCMSIRQLNDANTMIRKLRHCNSVDSDNILRTFAARCDTTLESRNFCGLGYLEKLKNKTFFERS